MGKATKATPPDAGQRTLFGFFKKSGNNPARPAQAAPPARPLPPKASSSFVSEPIAVSSDVEEASTSFNSSMTAKHTASTMTTPPSERPVATDMDVDPQHDSDPPTSSLKKPKRKAIVPDSSDEEEPVIKPPKKPRVSQSKPAKTKKAAVADEDDFVVPDDASDDFDNEPDAVDFAAIDEDDNVPAPKAKPAPAKALPKPKPAPKKPSASTQADRSRKELEAAKKAAKDGMFEFLREIKDADGNPVGHPDYDPRTLYVPSSAFGKMTPFEKQYWEIKRNHFDTVLFFQKGKFFELYETDASIGHQEFDLKMTDRVKMRMVGVPEAQFELWANKFLARGYKVGRVEQSETALGAEMRKAADKSKGKATKGKEDKLVGRSLKSVYTSGTLVEGVTEDMGTHCVCIKETLNSEHLPIFGFAILDAATAEFNLIGFEDDISRTKLETLFRQLRPEEVIHEKGHLSGPTKRVLKNILPGGCRWTALRPGAEYPDFESALALVAQKCRGGASSAEDPNEDMDGDTAALPAAVKAIQSDQSTISALGGLLSYLQSLMLDQDLCKVGNFNLYELHGDHRAQRMILDGQSLAHIEVLQNSLGTEDGTLLRLMNRCVTPAGKRLFKLWLCQPLCHVDAINERLDAVEDLMRNTAFQDQFIKMNKGVIDLERVLSRIHAGSCKPAVFQKALSNLKTLDQLFESLKSHAGGFKSKLLIQMLEKAPQLTAHVEAIEASFVEDEGLLLPCEGADEDYDENQAAIQEAEEALDDLLEKSKEKLGCDSLVFKHIGTKDIYQIEVPNKAKVEVPDNWRKMSNTTNVKRYYFDKLEKLIRSLKEAKETNTGLRAAFQGKLYGHFSEHYPLYLSAVRLVAQIDCLLSLSKTSLALGEPSCRPAIVEAPTSFCDFRQLRHPCLLDSRVDFIPNDVKLGAAPGDTDPKPNLILLTGPNMAGKSTLLRMTAAATIMAQVGCFVPAESATICPVERILTRMGANDAIFNNASTFKVEMDDTTKILTDASPRTLVVLDELGRGTSSHDGTAIAFSVLHTLATYRSCIGFFSTHYSLHDFEQHSNVRACHMATLIQDGDITFLYQLAEGITTKSYGPAVAKLAGVPETIVERALKVSEQFATETKAREISKRVHDAKVPIMLQSDANWLAKVAQTGLKAGDQLQFLQTLKVLRANIGRLCIQDQA